MPDVVFYVNDKIVHDQCSSNADYEKNRPQPNIFNGFGWTIDIQKFSNRNPGDVN
tara:strand:+ start:722 stop:886 length:165 start_codon:yes stop_codon:yes gene_type:complete